MKGDSGDRGVAGSRGSTVKRGPAGPGVVLERLVKWDLLEHVVELEHVVNRVTRETLAVLVNKGLYVHK